MATDAGSGLEHRDNYKKYHPWPLKFPDGKTYLVPMLPLDVDESDEREMALLDALETWEAAVHGDGVVTLTQARKLKLAIVRAALLVTYEAIPEKGLGVDVPTFNEVYKRLCGGQLGKGAGDGAST